MKPFFKFLTLAFVALWGWANAHGQQKDDYSAQIDSLIQTTTPRAFNGVVLITQKGKTLYSRAWGYANFEHKTPLTENDIFRIQSNSKQITAVLILREVEKGRIDLQSPVRKYLPDLQQTWADSVTVHQLLNFSAGVSEIDKPLVFKPGTGFLYGVATYTMLANIIEKVTGSAFAEVAHDLFKELNMHNTFCDLNAETSKKAVEGYADTKPRFKPIKVQMTEQERRAFLPAGGIMSSAKDLNIWDTKLHTGKILKPESYQKMTSYNIMAQHETFGTEKIGYGYGVRVSDKTPVKHIGHSGKGLGFISIKVYFPDQDVDLIVLENLYSEDSTHHYHFEKAIKDIVMKSSLVSL